MTSETASSSVLSPSSFKWALLGLLVYCLLLVVQCAVQIGTSVNIVLRQERRRTERRCAWHAVNGMGRYPDPAPLRSFASQLHDSSSSAVASSSSILKSAKGGFSLALQRWYPLLGYG